MLFDRNEDGTSLCRRHASPLACNNFASGNSSFYLLPAASPITHIDWRRPDISRFLTNSEGCLREPGLRQGYNKALLIFLERHPAALNRTELPALKIVAQLQPNHGVSRLIDEDAELGVIRSEERRVGKEC